VLVEKESAAQGKNPIKVLGERYARALLGNHAIETRLKKGNKILRKDYAPKGPKRYHAQG